MVKHRLLLAVLAGLLAASPALADRGGRNHDDRRGSPGWDRGHGHGRDRGWDRDWDRGRGHGRHDGRRHGSVVVVPPPPPRVVYAPPPRVYYLAPYPRYPIVIGKPLPRGIRYHRPPVVVMQQMPVCRSGVECIMVGTDMLILDAVHGAVRDIIYGAGRF